MNKKKIGIFGSTGSIGTQTLQVIRNCSEQFEATILVANNNAALLIEQAIEFRPALVVITNTDLYATVSQALSSYGIIVTSGTDAILEAAKSDYYDFMMAAISGYNGLFSVVEAIQKGKTIGLANKESIVVAGNVIIDLCKKHNALLLPVDSEHAAIFQCLMGEHNLPHSIEKIILTASGGPFRGRKPNFLINVRKEHALQHPIWKMGSKISIDSATLMNKGLELIEAKWLFDVAPEQLDVLVHPQCIIHSIVCFKDGNIKAQLSTPSMCFPIQFALTYPQRLFTQHEAVKFAQIGSLNFEEPDIKTFRCLQLAKDVLAQGGNFPSILNTANEEAVSAFLNNKIKFLEIANIVESVLEQAEFIAQPSLDDYKQLHEKYQIITQQMINKPKAEWAFF